jgi:predicted hydrocarbon binding protein
LYGSKSKIPVSWDLIGDIDSGRPNLGRYTRLEVYRMMQFTFRDVIERRYGTEEADRIFYEAGQEAGVAFYKNVIGDVQSVDEFVKRLQEELRAMAIGILRVEKTDLEKGEIVVTISEDLDCSGLPELDYEICTYDEGFIAGLLESFTGAAFKVKEIDCWCTGDRTCRFHAQRV